MFGIPQHQSLPWSFYADGLGWSGPDDGSDSGQLVQGKVSKVIRKQW